MYKKIAVIFLILVGAFSFLIMRTYILSVETVEEVFARGAGSRETRITLSDNRGIIYDRDGNKLTNKTAIDVAVIDPQLVENSNVLRSGVALEDREKFDSKIEGNKLFTAAVNGKVATGAVLTKKVTRRYSIPYLAAHVIGYTDENGRGVSGIEKAYNDILSSKTEFCAVFPADAVRRAISGLGYEILGKEQHKTGVTLTLSESVQNICEQAADKYIENGAVTVLSVETGEILALVSRPTFSQDDPSSSVGVKEAFINKALLPYNVGSSFKICDAAAFLECGGDVNKVLNCSGAVTYGDISIGCLDIHGNIDMKTAFAESCNCYFIKLAEIVGREMIYEMAEKCGMGKSIFLADGMGSASGNLPSLKDLSSKTALANMAIGQGEMMATPLQVSAFSMMVASGGINKTPYLVKSVTDESGIEKQIGSANAKRIISSRTAEALQDLMINTAENGSGRLAMPEVGGAGVKTATAQTGIKKDGRLILQGWITGFFPAENPKYVVTVLVEDVLGGGRSAGPVFKYIADGINGSIH